MYDRGRPVLVAFLTSLITTAVAFAALTVADRRGLLDFLRGKRGDVEVPSINGVSVEQARDLLRARAPTTPSSSSAIESFLPATAARRPAKRLPPDW
jgi:hypothetical protein